MNILFSKLDTYKALQNKTYESDSVIVGVLGALAWEYRVMDIDSAIYYFEEGLGIAKKIKFIRGIGIMYNQGGSVYRHKGELVKSLELYNKAMDAWHSFQKTNPGYYSSIILYEESRTLNNMGIVYQILGETTKALDLYFKALKIDEAKGNKAGAANKLGNIGNIFNEQRQYDKALEYYFRVLAIDESLGNKRGMGSCYGNMGLAYWGKGDRNKAIEYYTKSIDIHKSIGSKRLLSENYGNMALIYEKEKKYNEALDYYNRSLQLKEETDDRPGTATILSKIGDLYLSRDMLPEAENYLLRSKLIADSVGEKRMQEELYHSLSSLYTKKEQYREALTYQQKAASLKDSLYNEQKTEEITSKEMTYAFEKRQDSTKAEYSKQLAVEQAQKLTGIAEADKKRILAELNQAEADRKLTETEINNRLVISEADKKRIIAEAERTKIVAESEKTRLKANADIRQQKLIRNSIAAGGGVIILASLFIFLFYKRKRDAVQKQKETALNLQVSETEMKALRSQMNPHFIFNALHSIQLFLTSNKTADANTYLVRFAKLMRLVLENSQRSEVPIKEDFQALECYMQLESIRLTHPFTHSFHVDKTIDTEAITIPPLILQPFVENAIWHGLHYKPEPGRIDIHISSRDNMLYVIVEDNGIGRQAAKKNGQRLFTEKGSFGIRLTEERLNILNQGKNIKAKLEIIDLFTKDNQPAGTRVELFLPLIA